MTAPVATRLLLDRRRSFLWWTFGVVMTVVLTVAFWPSIRGEKEFEDLMRDLPEAVRAIAGASADIPFTSAPGYVHSRLFATLLPVLLLVFGIGIGTRAIGGAEEDGTLELLLAQPLTRARLVGERYVAMVGLLAGLSVVTVVSLLAVGPAVGALDGIALSRLTVAVVAVLGLAVLHASLAFAAGCTFGRRGTASAVAGAVAVGGYLLYGLGAASDALDPVRIVSPWQWYLERNLLAQPARFQAVVLPYLVSALLLAAGRAAFLRRDLRLP